MSFLLWHTRGDARIASPRLVLRAAEVPLLQEVHALRDRLVRLLDDEGDRIAAAADESRTLGHAQGVEQGRREAGDELAAALLSLAQSAEREREVMRGEIGVLALQVVRKLLGSFADDAVLAALADKAAREMVPAQQLCLVVHPDLRDAVRERLSAAQGDAEATALRWEVRGDQSCGRDACRIETEHGRVDATLEAQLARLAQAWAV